MKVEVDLLGEFPKRIKIGIKQDGGEVLEKWVQIKYDYLPRYCQTCLIHGHDEEQCYVKHPELFKKQTDSKGEENKEAEKGESQNKQAGKENPPPTKEDGFTEPKKKKRGRKQQPQQVWQANTCNKFEKLDSQADKA